MCEKIYMKKTVTKHDNYTRTAKKFELTSMEVLSIRNCMERISGRHPLDAAAYAAYSSIMQ